MLQAQDDPAPDRGIRLQSRLLSMLFLLLFVLAAPWAAYMVGAFLLRIDRMAAMVDTGFAFEPLPWLEGTGWPRGFTPISHFAVWQSLLIAMLLAMRLLPGLVILWHLRMLFCLYASGQVFSARNALQVRRIARALLAYALVPLITHASLYFAHVSTHVFKWEIRQLDALVAGLVLITVARVMQFGHEIERDRDGFV